MGTPPSALLFAALSRGLERHRAAVLAGDHGAVERAALSLAPLLADLAELTEAPGGGTAAAQVNALARQARQQLRLNQTLIANGMAITDHYALCVAEAAPVASPALLSEVA